MVNLKDPAVDNWQSMSNFQILMMASSHVHAADAGVHCLRNVLHAAMGIAVLNGCEDDVLDGKVPCVPDSAGDFAQLVTEYARRDSSFQGGHFHSITGATLSAREEKGGKDPARHMNTPITLAAMVSPIALFFPLQLITMYLSKSDPAMWAKTIGNCKPVLLQDVEREIWMALFEIASGQKTPLSALLDCFDRIDWNAVETADCSNWFSDGFDDENCPRLQNFSDFHLASEVPQDWTRAQSFLDEVARRAAGIQPPAGPIASASVADPQPRSIDQDATPRNALDESLDNNTAPNPASGRDDSDGDHTDTPITPANDPQNNLTLLNPLPPLAEKNDGGQDQRPGEPIDHSPDSDDIPLLPASPPASPTASPALEQPSSPPSQTIGLGLKTTPAPLLPEKRKRETGEPKSSSGITNINKKAICFRSVTVKRTSSYARDIPAPMEVVESQALHKKIEFIDIDDITSGRPSTNADICEQATKLQNKYPSSFIVYNARGEEITITPELHHQHQLNSLFALVEASREGCYTKDKPNFITSKDDSIFHIMSEAAANTYDPEELLLLLQTNVLILTESKIELTTFDEDGLSDLKDLGAVISVHDYSEPCEDGDFAKRNKKTTLDVILNCTRTKGKILNALDIPMGWKGAPPTLFSSETRAWNATEGLPYCKNDPLPTDALRWALVATKGAHSPWHIDANGSAAFLVNGCGAKLIFVACLPDKRVFSQIDLFLNDFDQYATCSDRWNVEAIYLEPGDKIILPPNKPHSVFTSDNSICHGGHFYLSTTMTDTLVGIFQNFFCNSISTNTDHVEWRDLIHRMTVFYHDIIVTGSPIRDSRTRAHAPRLTDLLSLLNVYSTCALSILANALSPETYQPPEDDEEDDGEAGFESNKKSRFEMFDLNAMNGFTRGKCIHHRALAWEIIHNIDARYTFRNNVTDEHLSAFDNIFVPFISHLVRAAIGLDNEVAQLDPRPSIAKLTEGAFQKQARACFHLQPNILEAIDKGDEVDNFICPFTFDCVISLAEDFDGDVVGVKTSGETSRDVLYESGRDSSWKLYEDDNASGDDDNMVTDSTEEDDGDEYIPHAKRAKVRQ
ncbi:hypothetical protein GALMADRAFT_229041 [Galerina marginata CBS 339.88]|uniref:JmjC domain-containing protein n=1 Tax=Galerina marginata (strain CBS 339.88) TaxID=685588 RepID=A0A067SMM6_GALM3|nr:hypothetical protein GALMADRAFT_229041 [Galerina marginata CBS 339.88]